MEIDTGGGDLTLLLRSLPVPVSVAEVRVEVETADEGLTVLFRSLPIPALVAEV